MLLLALSIDPYALVNHVENLYISRGSHAVATMEIKKEGFSRNLKVEIWTKGRDRFLIRILEPARERGISTLRVGNSIWNYFPDIDRVMRIPPALLGDSWMGSHFTYDDLLKEVDISKDYLLKIKAIRGDTVVITATAKEDAAVVWDRLEYHILLSRKIPVRILMMDEDGKPVRIMTFKRTKRVKGKWIPLEIVIRPTDHPEEYTRIVYEKLQLDIDVPDRYFTLKYLRR